MRDRRGESLYARTPRKARALSLLVVKAALPDALVANPRLPKVPRHRAFSFRRVRELRREGFGLFEVVGAARGRKAFEERATVSLGVHAFVEQSDDARVFARSNEPAKSLLERDGGARHVIMGKGIFADRLDGR